MVTSHILQRLRKYWALLADPHPRKCRIGWHAWDESQVRDYGDKRTCRICGLTHYIHPDMGGVSAGTWEPFPYPEPSAAKALKHDDGNLPIHQQDHSP